MNNYVIIDLVSTLAQPQFKHDCEKCIYLGRTDKADFYFCRKHEDVIVRHSSEGPDYSSMDFETLNILKSKKMMPKRFEKPFSIVEVALGHGIFNHMVELYKKGSDSLKRISDLPSVFERLAQIDHAIYGLQGGMIASRCEEEELDRLYEEREELGCKAPLQF
jgi:hypothetical protein